MMDRRAGFTLIELLIALAILALVATLGYRAVASLTDSEAQLAAEGVHWRNLDAFFARLEADARAAVPREVRTGGRVEPAWVGGVAESGDAEMRFSRAGPEFSVESGSAGQRIGYRLRDGAVEVMYWPYLDQPATVTPQPYALVQGITRFRVTYLDALGQWRDRWPALGEPAIPRAIRIALTLANGEMIERWLALRRAACGARRSSWQC
jgi:general secretion pathway protein J